MTARLNSGLVELAHDDLKRLGRRLAGARVQRGMTQAQLAEIAHAPTNAISELETGKRAVRIDTFARIVRAAGLEIALQEPAA